MIDIVICSREEAGAILCSPAGRKDVVLLVSIGEAHDPAPAGFRNVSPRMRLLFPDTNGEAGATVDDVQRLIATAKAFAEKSGRAIIHCQAGISRSTAAATIFYAVLLGEGREDEAIARVIASRQFALPNRRMIRLADELLGRGGKLVAAVERALG
ncbi:MAG TPA: hypothetical protein VJZ76_06490 [Thermoanaerobaculia bacterium]|nr:hypothetical protein [Thermoanaerobaculia bacterium]